MHTHKKEIPQKSEWQKPHVCTCSKMPWMWLCGILESAVSGCLGRVSSRVVSTMVSCSLPARGCKARAAIIRVLYTGLLQHLKHADTCDTHRHVWHIHTNTCMQSHTGTWHTQTCDTHRHMWHADTCDTHTEVYARMHTHTRTHARTRACTHTHTHTHTCPHKHISTWVHTHAHTYTRQSTNPSYKHKQQAQFLKAGQKE